jgi:hypothetical protein
MWLNFILSCSFYSLARADPVFKTEVKSSLGARAPSPAPRRSREGFANIEFMSHI